MEGIGRSSTFGHSTSGCVVLRLIEKQIESSGKCPVTKEELTKDSICNDPMIDIMVNKYHGIIIPCNYPMIFVYRIAMIAI